MSKFSLYNPLNVKEVVSLSLLKHNNMRFLYAFAIAMAVSLCAIAQTTDQSYTIEQYVTEILIGDGINVSNITLIGGEDQLGYMSGAEGVFSVGAGLVLSTDNALNLTDPACGANICNGCMGGGTDVDLLNVANSVPPLIGQGFSVSSVNDLCVLEFDFEASGDSIAFNYVFGSDEYLEWVNSSFNDIFAFFLSGPGITGPFAAPAGFPDGAINIAEVPDSDPLLPITISSVNDVTNPEYYIDNFNNDGICIDGYTQTFTASAQVQCGETYHIKLAIADGSDTALESFVILEEGSFSSNAIDIVADASIEGVDVFLGDTTVVEGCNDATFTVIRPDDSTLDTIILNVSGTAFPGIDYSSTFNEVIMEPGQSSAEITLGVINDNIEEDPEWITIEYVYVNGCGDTIVTSATIMIRDPDPITLLTEPIGCLDEDDGITLSVTALTGFAPYEYQWDTDPSHTEPTFYYDTGGIPDTATVIVTDICGSITEAQVVWDVLDEYIGSDLSLCFGQSGNIPVTGGTNFTFNGTTYNGFSEILAYQGEDEDGNEIWTNIIGVDTIISVIDNQASESGLYYGYFDTGLGGTGTIELQLIDGCGNITFSDITVEYCELEFYNVFTPDNTLQNQFFEIVGLQGYSPSRFYVYNRWGSLVFEDINFEGTWNGINNYGQDLEEGNYYYVVYVSYDHSDDPDLSGLYDVELHEDFITADTSEEGVVKFLGNVTIFRKLD